MPGMRLAASLQAAVNDCDKHLFLSGALPMRRSEEPTEGEAVACAWVFCCGGRDPV